MPTRVTVWPYYPCRWLPQLPPVAFKRSVCNVSLVSSADHVF